MSDIVIIPVYNRAEYLPLCLEFLSKAEGIETKEIWVCIDRGMNPAYRALTAVVAEWVSRGLRIVTYVREPHKYYSGSYNALEAYVEAFFSDARFVYYVEDDTFVQPDFFKWHEAVQADGDYACSIAIHSNSNEPITDPSAYFTFEGGYDSHGVCWKRENLKMVVEHFVPEYYAGDRVHYAEYLEKQFPKSAHRKIYVEHDGLIHAILEANHGVVAYPFVPRCYHIGFAGHNRMGGPKFTTAELKEIIYDADKVHAADVHGTLGVMPRNPVPEWSEVHCTLQVKNNGV
jgi:Glycosyl transferase family 2